MTLVDGVVLGLVQGLTEFLPVSSSGHLVLAQELLGAQLDGVWLEIAVHVGTLVSVLLYFRRDIAEIARDTVLGGERRRETGLVILATLPVVFVAFTVRHEVEALLDSPRAAAVGLCITGVLLLLTRLARRSERPHDVRNALLIGVAQACAVVPGISRSGSTIGVGLLLGEESDRAARFSFLLSIPAIAGAAILQIFDGAPVPEGAAMTLVAATAVAFASGLAAIYVLMKLVVKGRLAVFGPYCLAVGVIGLVLL